MPIGIREHLTVGRLLSRWQGEDLGELRSALAAVLARSPEEQRLVQATFDQLYPGTIAEQPPEQLPLETTPEPGRMPWWRKARGLALLTLLTLVVVAATLFQMGLLTPVLPSLPLRPNSDVQPDPASRVRTPPQPRIVENTTTLTRINWWKASGCALLAAALAFAWAYERRTQRAALAMVRRNWSRELDDLPGPATYELRLSGLEPPFSAGLLDDLAALLGRRRDHPGAGREIDLERTIERTLREGLAPHLVFQTPKHNKPFLVLEDVGHEMWPWRHRVAALLDGLAARGVALERWQFDSDAGRLFQGPEGGITSLRRLARSRLEQSLLIISSGGGIHEGEERRPADWVGLLSLWRSRAWLHPVEDRRYWRADLQEIGTKVWPLNPAGLLAAARDLPRAQLWGRERSEPGLAVSRSVAPLDVARLSWLLSLAPRHDPKLAELLRQHFCPHVPPATLLEALAVVQSSGAISPGSWPHPGVGPAAEEVHAFLAETLAESEPATGTAAYVQWKLDLVLQQLRSGQDAEARQRARHELEELAAGPGVTLVQAAAARVGLDASTEQGIQSALRRRASGEIWKPGARSWTQPKIREGVVALAFGLLVLLAAPKLGVLTTETGTRGQEVYELSLDEERQPGIFVLKRREGVELARAPDRLELMMAASGSTSGNSARPIYLFDGIATIELEGLNRDRFYWARADLADSLVALSNPIWLPPAKTVVEPPVNARLKVEFASDPPGRAEVVLPDEFTLTLLASNPPMVQRGRPGEIIELPAGSCQIRVAATATTSEVMVLVDIPRSDEISTLIVKIPVKAEAPPSGSLRVRLMVDSVFGRVPAGLPPLPDGFTLRSTSSGSSIPGRFNETLKVPVGEWQLDVAANTTTKAAKTQIIVQPDVTTEAEVTLELDIDPDEGWLLVNFEWDGPPDTKPALPSEYVAENFRTGSRRGRADEVLKLPEGLWDVTIYATAETEAIREPVEIFRGIVTGEVIAVRPLSAKGYLRVELFGNNDETGANISSPFSVYPAKGSPKDSRSGTTGESIELEAGEWVIILTGEFGVRSERATIEPGKEAVVSIPLGSMTLPDQTIQLSIMTTQRSDGPLSLQFYDTSMGGPGAFEIPFNGTKKGVSKVALDVEGRDFLDKKFVGIANTGKDNWAGEVQFSLDGELLFTLTIKKNEDLQNGARTTDLALLLKTKSATLSPSGN